MPFDNQSPLKLDASLVARLACPACHGELRLDEKKAGCMNCGRSYSVIDGIPVLIPERAKLISADNRYTREPLRDARPRQ